MKSFLNGIVSKERKKAIKMQYGKLKGWTVRTFMSYDGRAMREHLVGMGISESDTVMVHANFNPENGFRGNPIDVVEVFSDLLGTSGNLLMVSIPFRGSAYDHLMQKKPFRVRKTMSMMGMITEIFRRKEGVLRSFHPTHPVLAYGKDSKWFVEGHESCLYPCGPGTPFDKFRQRNGKILFFDVGFGAITFFHHVEDLYKEKLPFPVYHEEIISTTGYDEANEPREIRTYVFNRNLPRSAEKLEREMETKHFIRKSRIGNTRILLVRAEDVVTSMRDMIDSGNFPYEVDNHEINQPSQGGRHG